MAELEELREDEGALNQATSAVVDNLGLIGGGTMLTAAVLMGLRSFGKHAALYGGLGQAMANPLEATMLFLQRARQLYREGEPLAGDITRSALVSYALDGPSRDRIREMARQLRQTEAVVERAARLFVEADAEAQMRRVQASMRRSARRARHDLTRAILHETGIDSAQLLRHVRIGEDLSVEVAPKEAHGLLRHNLEVLERAYLADGKLRHLPRSAFDHRPDKLGAHAAPLKRAAGLARALGVDPVTALQQADAKDRRRVLRRLASKVDPTKLPGFSAAAESAWEAYVQSHPNLGLLPFGQVGLQGVLARAEQDSQLARLISAHVGTPPEQRVSALVARAATPAGRPTQVNHLSVAGMLRDQAKNLYLTRLGSADIASLTGDEALTPLFEQVKERLKRIQDTIQAETGRDIRLSATLKQVDERHRVIHFLAQEGDKRQHFNLPVASPLLTYMRERGGHAFAAGPQLTQDPYLAGYVGRPLIRPDELVLADILEHETKFLSDLRDGRGVDHFAKQVTAMYKRHFRSKDYESGSPIDLVSHAGRVHMRVMDVFDQLRGDRRRAQELHEGLTHLERLRSAVESGTPYAAFDIEFWSEQSAKGRGSQYIQAARGELPYHIATAFMEEGDTQMLVDYKARMFEHITGDERARLFQDYAKMDTYEARVLQSIREFQSRHMKPDDADKLIGRLKEGELTIRQGGTRYVYNPEAGAFLSAKGEHLDVGVTRAAGESFEAFYARTLARIMEERAPQFAAGHYASEADLPIMQTLFAKHGIELPEVFHQARMIDTFKVLRALTMESGPALGNEAMLARLSGLSQDEFQQAMKVASREMRLRDVPRSSRARVKPVVQTLQDLQARAGNRSLHSADVDALLSGQLGVRLLYQHAQTPEMQLAARRARDVLAMMNKPAGLLAFTSKEYEHLYGYDEDEGLLNFAFVSQEEAAFGGGSLLRGRILPFHRLLNPSRQRYQNLKQQTLRRLGGAMRTGAYRPVRAIGDWLGDMTLEGRAYDIESKIYEGYGLHTSAFMDAFEGEVLDRSARIGLTAYLPESVYEVYESNVMLATPMAAATYTPRVPQRLKLSVDFDALVARSKRGLMDVIRRYHPTAQTLADARKADGHLWRDRSRIYREIAMLEELAKEATPEGQKAIARGLEELVRRLEGRDIEEFREEAFRHLNAENPAAVWKGRALRLFRDDVKDPIVTGGRRGPKYDLSAPLSVEINMEEKEVSILHITDPGTYVKLGSGPTNVSKGTATVHAGLELFPGSGIQVGAPAMALKHKRGDYGSYLIMEMGRVQRRANEQLEIARLRKKELGSRFDYESARNRIQKEFAEALSQATGGRVSADKVLADRIITVASKGGEDLLTLRLTAEFMEIVENTTSQLKLMNMARRAGLTFSQVHQHAVDMIEAAMRKGAVSAKRAKELIADVPETMKRQVRSDLAQLRQTLSISGMSLPPEKRAEINETITRYEKALKDIERSSEGATFDVISLTNRREEDMANTPALLFQEAHALLEHSVTHATSVEQIFAAGTGRITRKKRMSMLDAALFSRVFGEFSTGGPAGAVGVLGRAFMAAQRGFGKTSDTHMAAVVREEQFRGKGSLTPYSLSSSIGKAQAALHHMITGQLPMPGARIYTADFERSQTPIDEILHGLREEDRSRAAFFARYGRIPTKEELKEFGDSSKIFIGSAPGMISATGENPLLRTDLDFVEMKLFTPKASREVYEEALRQAGVPETTIQMLLGQRNAVEAALLSADPDELVRSGDPEARALANTIALLREKAGGSRLRSSFILPTIGDRLSFRGEGRYQVANLPVEFRIMIETQEAMRTAAGSISRVMEMALRDPKGYKSKIEEELHQGHVQAALNLLQRADEYAAKSLGLLVMQEMELGMSAFLEGQYKWSAAQQTAIPKLQRLASAYGTERFGQIVEEMVMAEKNVFGGVDMRTINPDRFREIVREATEGLERYVGAQLRQGFGTEVWKWHGFAAGEGILSASLAERVLRKNEEMYEVLKDKPMSQLKGTLAEPYLTKEAMLAEIDHMRAALEGRAGYTILTVGMREPSFENLMPMSAAQATVMQDAAMRALGFDPNEVAVFGDPVRTWTDRQDFDGDIRFQALISQPALNAAIREQMASQTGAQMRAFFNLFEDGDVRKLGLERIEEIDGRVILKPLMGGHELPSDMVGKAFAFAGQALAGRSSDADKRGGYALQKDIIGSFGAFQKRSALAAAHHSIFAELVRQAGETPGAFTADELARMNRVLASAEQLSAVPNVFGGADQMLAAAEAYIKQEGAIEKYKMEGASSRAVQALDMLGGVFAKRGERGYEAAMKQIFSAEALRGESLAKFYWQAAGVRTGADVDVEAALRSDAARYLRQALSTRYEKFDITFNVQRRAAMTDSYRYYTKSQPVEAALLTGEMRRSRMLQDQGVRDAFIGEVAFKAHAAAELADRLAYSGMIDLFPETASVGRSVAAKLAGLSPGSRIGLGAVVIGLGALAGTQDNVAREQQETVRYQAHSRQTTRRMIESRERASRELAYAGISGVQVRRGFAVPTPPSQRYSY